MKATSAKIARPSHGTEAPRSTLRPSAAEHPLEREADRVATHVMSGAQLAPPAHADQSATSKGKPGAQLDPRDRAFFEQRMGQDFGSVRIHAGDDAARQASAYNARAFTVGSSIYFARDEYVPGAQRSRALLAHELVHVTQSRRGGVDSRTAWRVPDEPSSDPTVAIELSVTTSSDLDGAVISNEIPPGIVNFQTPLFEEDVFGLSFHALSPRAQPQQVKWTAPEGIDHLQDLGPHAAQFRVADGAAGGNRRVLEIEADDGSGKPVKIRLTIEFMPKRASAVDPRLEANEQARKALREERKQSRNEFKSKTREERREGRDARRDQRRDERKRARELRRERRDLEESCTLEQQRMIDVALTRAIQVSVAALTRLSGGNAVNDAKIASAFDKYLKAGATPISAPLLQHVIDVLAVARTSMMLATHGEFTCTTCKETTGAFVIASARGGEVNICQKWIVGNGLKFDVTSGVDDARAFALLHEYCHLAGVSGPADELYVSEDTWAKVSAADAYQSADAYAAIAWVLAGSASGASP